jgi:hypothetical protein
MIELKCELDLHKVISLEFISEPSTGDMITIDGQHFFIQGRRWLKTENKIYKPCLILHDLDYPEERELHKD